MKMTYKSRTFILLFLTIIIIFSSCIKDNDVINDDIIFADCPKYNELGNFYLLENSIEFMPYKDSIQKIIFSDSIGNKFTGKVTNNETYLSSILRLTEYPCIEDSNQTFQYKYRSETKNIVFEFEQLNIEVELILTSNLTLLRNHKEVLESEIDSFYLTDALHVILISPISNNKPNSQFQIRVNSRKFPNPETETPQSISYNFHGKIFHNVYHHNADVPNGKFELFYNKEFGFIGLENHDKSISIKFESWE